MGNTCVNGGVVGDDWLTVLISLWGLKSMKVFCCVDRGERIGEMSPVEGLKFPGNGIVPPEILKIDYWGVLKLAEKKSIAVAELELEQKLPAAAGAWEEPIKDGKTKPSLIFYTDDEIPERNEVRKPKISGGMMSFGLQVKSVLRTETGHLKQHFNLGKNLGHGQFGKTFLCVEKSTGKGYACKSIAKRKLLTQEDVDDVRREIEIMHHLSGNPNVISIKGAYEDSVAVHAVMELCTGGELFERIVKRGHYSEKKASELARTIVGVVETCHSLGVMHRDLKPENFLFVNEEEDSPIKAIDFGLSMYFKPGEVFSDIVGSPFYVAPEVLCQRYGPEADIWSAGVIIYIMLSGTPPFWGESEEEVFEDILRGDIDFTSDPWPIISESAKDLVKKMLKRDPRKRLTAHQVLCHPWLQVEGEAPDKPLDSAILTRLTEFSAMEHIKKMALRVIAESLSEEEIAGLKEMFKMIDTDNSGYITFEELKDGLRQFGANSSESQILHLMKATDINNNGAIDYGEFLAATLHSNKIDKEDHLLRAFSYFDKDGSGYITQDELKKHVRNLAQGSLTSKK